MGTYEPIFYYLRDSKKRPRITVALCDPMGDGRPCRGVAICSADDQPSRKFGRFLSESRMWDAFERKEDSSPIRRQKAFINLYDSEYFGDYSFDFELQFK